MGRLSCMQTLPFITYVLVISQNERSKTTNNSGVDKADSEVNATDLSTILQW